MKAVWVLEGKGGYGSRSENKQFEKCRQNKRNDCLFLCMPDKMHCKPSLGLPIKKAAEKGYLNA